MFLYRCTLWNKFGVVGAIWYAKGEHLAQLWGGLRILLPGELVLLM